MPHPFIAHGAFDMLENKTNGRTAADPADAAGDGAGERRRQARVPVIKSAKIYAEAGGSHGVYNCLVLDKSAGGVQVDFGAMLELPEEVTLRMNGGATYLARRCWSVGEKAGLAFIGGQIINDETVLRLLKIAEVLRAQGVLPAVATLRSARFFDNTELRRTAEAVEAAFYRFEAVLTGRKPI
jgi:PilZ domain